MLLGTNPGLLHNVMGTNPGLIQNVTETKMSGKIMILRYHFIKHVIYFCYKPC